MRIIIDARVDGKVQLLPSSMGWFHRITFFRWGKKFREVIDVDGNEFSRTISIPGPLDVTIEGSISPVDPIDPLEGSIYTVTATLHVDGLPSAVIWTESDSGELASEYKFKFSGDGALKGNGVRGTIRIEA